MEILIRYSFLRSRSLLKTTQGGEGAATVAAATAYEWPRATSPRGGGPVHVKFDVIYEHVLERVACVDKFRGTW